MADVCEGNSSRATKLNNDGANGWNGIENRGNEREQINEGKPKVGMMFKDTDELYVFYKAYARAQGFGISKRGGEKDELTGQQRWMTITCSKDQKHKTKGSNLLSQRPTGRLECKARVCGTEKDGVWIISKVVLKHNHDVSPAIARHFRQHREVDVHSKRQLELNDMAGLRPCQNIKVVVFQAGGHEELSCLKKDLANHINKVRRLQLNGGDAEVVHQMFSKMQTESREFVYVIKPDKEGRLKHVFWADGRSRIAYQEFCDVVTFDTTYLVNRYDMPFAAFVGVNHHNQSILLGCALLNNEKSKTFQWLFQTWLRCMEGKPPGAIIIDQCRAIGEAVEVVFPNTRHRLCLWHIMGKLPTKFAKNPRNHVVQEAFKDTVYDSISFEEFEEKWSTMISKFELEKNEWLARLFENRKRWVPEYVKSSFWAGMSTTQRSEGVHAFFDGYVHSRTSLRQFVQQYGLALQDKVEKEMKEDFVSGNSRNPCVTRFKFEEQLRSAYTNAIFKLVQKHLTDIMYCDARIVSQEGSLVVTEVTEMVIDNNEGTRNLTYIVKFDVERELLNCSCQLFEFKGMFCAHVFKVLATNGIEVIPKNYILQRWRKDVFRCHTTKKVAGSTFLDSC